MIKHLLIETCINKSPLWYHLIYHIISLQYQECHLIDPKLCKKNDTFSSMIVWIVVMVVLNFLKLQYHTTIQPIMHFRNYQLSVAPLVEPTVHPKKYAHGFVVLCFVVVMQSFIMNSHEVFIHIHQGCFAGTGAIVRLPQCQWSKPDGYGKISQCITTTKHSKAKTVCIFLGIYCISAALIYLVYMS